MSDIRCMKCGEPWDAYGVANGDMEADEAEKFRKGLGCPSCGFGKQCVGCDGTGRYREHVMGEKECCFNAKGIVLGRVIVGATPGTVYSRQVGEASSGFESRVRALGAFGDLERKQLGVRKFPERIRSGGPDCDGVRWVEYWFVCPDCHGDIPGVECGECQGTGELAPDRVGGDVEWATRVWSHLDATDEDPIKVLDDLGLNK